MMYTCEQPHNSLGHRRVCWNWNSELSLIILGKFESSTKKNTFKKAKLSILLR